MHFWQILNIDFHGNESSKTGDQSRGSFTPSTRRSSSYVSADARPGWPLLGRSSSLPDEESKEKKKLSVVEWAMNLPDRSMQSPPRSAASEFPLSKCRWLSYRELNEAVSGFHQDNMIGNGGSNRVYKGTLRGNPVALRIQNSSEEARKEFALEVDIVTSLKHRNVASLVGICVEEKNLISVYDYMPRGTLEENLKRKSALPWSARFTIAIEIAEAVNYLHSKCLKPVIHRDIKSSNILLTNDFKPKLSDFGLAIWGPTRTPFISHADAVGTFGYIAPEYFMHGKVSDKVDVYAYGVVLLELLSGRKPIDGRKQGSLVMWANPILESKNYTAIVDPDLQGKFDTGQVKRVAVAAKLCLKRSPGLRPTMSEILRLLRGEKWRRKTLSQEDDDDDDIYPSFRTDLYLAFAMREIEESSKNLSR